MSFVKKIRYIAHIPASLFALLFRKKPIVFSKNETLDEMRSKSICRYGDGELLLMMGVGIKFQKKDRLLQKRLIEIANTNSSNHVVAIPPVFDKKSIGQLDQKVSRWWKKNLFCTRSTWYKYFKNEAYYNSFVSRFYLESKDKSDDYIFSYLSKLKSLWKNKNVLFVEGSQSKLGVGNDLFSDCKSIRRIIAPSTNAFEKYSQILSSTLNNSTNDDLIICALGPTATVLAYDLSTQGRHALDLGHVDIEYEWLVSKATKPIGVVGKSVSESSIDLSNEDNGLVVDNIICKII